MSMHDLDPMGVRRGPYLDLLGLKPELLAPGRVRVVLEVARDHLRTRGIVHGGVLASLLDTALGLAASSRAPAGLDVVTAQLNVNFLRPARVGDTLAATAEVKHAGRKTAVAWAEVFTAGGELVATGSATLVYVPASDLGPPRPANLDGEGCEPRSSRGFCAITHGERPRRAVR